RGGRPVQPDRPPTGRGGGEGCGGCRGSWGASPRSSIPHAGGIGLQRGRSVDRGVGDRRLCLLPAAPGKQPRPPPPGDTAPALPPPQGLQGGAQGVQDLRSDRPAEGRHVAAAAEDPPGELVPGELRADVGQVRAALPADPGDLVAGDAAVVLEDLRPRRSCWPRPWSTHAGSGWVSAWKSGDPGDRAPETVGTPWNSRPAAPVATA